MGCQKCQSLPGSHSFVRLGRLPSGISVFYTCPAKAKDFKDEPMFLGYFATHLETTENKPWIWIFDCQGFGKEHMTSLATVKGLTNLLQTTYKDSLQDLYIVHEAWHFHLLLSAVMPFVNKKFRKHLHQIKGSTLEILVEFEKKGLPMSLLAPLREPPLSAPRSTDTQSLGEPPVKLKTIP